MIVVYQAISAEAFLDSDANVSIFTLDNEPHMTDKVASKLSVTGFSGKDLEGKSDGMAKMYIFDPNNPGDGHHVDVPATTMKGDANASLLSAWHMVKRMGYTLTLTPDGKADGFSRKESDGSVTRLPATADKNRGMWIIHYTISASAVKSRKLAIQKHRAFVCRESNAPGGSNDGPLLRQLCQEGSWATSAQLGKLMNSHLDAGDGLQSADSNEYLRWARASPQFHSHFGTLPQDDDQNQDVLIQKQSIKDQGMEKQGIKNQGIRNQAIKDDSSKEISFLRLPDGSTCFAGPAIAGASADDDSDDWLISPEDEQIYKDTEAVIKPSQRPRDKALIQKVRHFKFGHHGPCPGGCDICKQTSGTLRKVISGGTPSFDDEAGRTFGMDSLYWDVESRHGNKYTVVMRDERTLWIGGFHMAKRSDATRLFKEYIIKMRADPELKCPHFCTRIRIDNAGEWGASYDEWQQCCIDLGIEVLQPPSKSDHRMNSLAESAVFLTKLHAQRVLLGTRLEFDMWEEAVNFVWFIRQHTVTKRVASPHGKGPAPITELSNNNVDYEECARRKDYAWPPGTLCLVHDPGKHGGAEDITHARYGRVIKQEILDLRYKDEAGEIESL